MLMAWEKVKLGDIATCIQPGPFGSQLHNSDYSESGTPIIMPKDMIDGKISHSNLIFVGEEHTKRLCRHQVHAGNLMVARKGDVRKCVFITENEDGWMTGSDCLKVALKENYCYPRFIYYQLRSPFIGRWLEKISIGATMPSINTGLLSSIELVLPSLKEQKRIADILSAYDDLIENNQKQIKLLEEAAQRLYKQWFIDLRYPGHETTKIVDGLPEGWRNVTLGDVYGKIESGSRPKGGIDSSIRDGVVSVGAENVIGLGQYNYSSEKLVSHEFYENSKRGKVEDRDILVYKDGAYIGRTSLFQDEFPRKVMMVNEHVFLLNAKNPLYQYYLFFTLNRQEYFDKMQKLNKNSAQPGINQDALKSLVIIWPLDEIAMKFDNFVAPMVKKIFALAKQNYELSQSRDRLLPKLMDGELCL